MIMPGLNTKSYYTGVVDNNDLSYVIERFGNPKRVLPAPISRFKIGEYKGKPKINPHVSSFFMKDGRTVSVFHVKPVYYLHINGEWRPLSEVTTYHGNRKLILNNKWEQIEPWYLRWLMKRCELIGGQVLIPWRFDNIPVREGQEIYFTVTTFYPDPNVENTSVDGWAQRGGVDEIWATIRSGAGNSSGDTDAATIFTQIRCSLTTNQWGGFRRGIFLFDTSSLGDDDTIDSAIFSIKGNDKTDNFSDSLSLVQSTPASNTAIVNADYSQVGTTKQATDITIASYSITAYNDWTLNTTGKASISKTGITKFGVGITSDVDNTEPAWASDNFSRVGGVLADTALTTSDPKLAVTHTSPVTGALQGFNMTGFWGA